jgi:hypothetical protein
MSDKQYTQSLDDKQISEASAPLNQYCNGGLMVLQGLVSLMSVINDNR